jgi:hypothetical protein
MIALHTTDLTHTPAAAEFVGHWHAIELQPEIEVPQRFVIGAAVSRNGKLVAWRLASEAPRLKCFYGQRYSVTTWQWMLQQLERDLAQAKGELISRFTSRSPQVCVGAGMHTSASSAEIALGRAFDRIVTVLNPQERKRSVQGIAQDDLREQVNEQLKLQWGLRFSRIAQESGRVVIKDGGEFHSFDVTHDDGQTATTVVSACYGTLETAKLNLMSATADLMRFREMNYRKQVGLAVLQPTSIGLPDDRLKAWMDFWHEETYKYKRADDFLIAEPIDVDGTVKTLVDWYPETTT